MEEAFDLTTALSNDIVGQKRTGKSKQFVFIRGNYAIKGPYQQVRFNNVITRSQIFSIWNTPFAVRAIDYFDVPDGKFVRFPNIMEGYQLQTDPYIETFSGLQYNVLKNPPVIDVASAINSGQWINEGVEDLILALCHCNILGVGDMNIRNTLIDPVKRQFYIIDFDDNLGKDRDDEVFYFNKAPGKKLMWYERVSYCYAKVSDRLIPLLEDHIVTTNNLVPRVERAIRLLLQFSTTKPPPTEQHVIQPKVKGPALIDVNNPFFSVQPTAGQIKPKVPKTPKQPKLLAASKDPNGIYFFNKGKYLELSNYWMKKDKSILFSIEGKDFKSGEHGFQYYKFYYSGANQDTLQYAELIRNAETANDAKLLANQKLRGGYQTLMNEYIRFYQTKAIINPNWENIKIDIMRVIISYKFTRDAHCQEILVSTAGKMLYENFPYDSFWGIGKDGNGQNWLGRLLVEFRDKLVPPSVSVQQPISTTLQNVPIVQPVPTDVNVLPTINKIGKMVWKGLRGGTKTYSGIDFDIAKSAVQKYIRRNMPQKAILAAIELYRLSEVGGDPGVTNMYNRLAIIANEDIGPANLPLVLEVTRIVEAGDRDIARLATMVQLLAESPKTRMMSHAWRAYANPEGRVIAESLGIPVDTEFNESDIAYINENKNSDLFVSTDPENIRPYILVFLKRLYEKDFNAYTWAYFFLEVAKDIKLAKRKKYLHGNTRSTTGKSDILLWKALSLILAPEIHDILVEAYYNHTESRPFLQNGILSALYGVSYKKFDIEPAVEIWRQQPVLQEMLNGAYTLEIDPYVIDKHTRVGRGLGKNIQEFVDEGAIVIPQDPTFYNETLETIYKMRT